MKKHLLMFLCISAFVLNVTKTKAQATVQIVHNCGDTLLAQVDVYVNGALALNDFQYRTATQFISLPSGVALNIGVAFSNSVSANDTVRNYQVTFTAGERYVVFVNGVFHVAKYAPNPNNQGTGMKLEIVSGVRATALNTGEVDLLAFNGCTELQEIDFRVRPNILAGDNLKFRDFSSYFSLNAAKQIIDLNPGAQAQNIIHSHVADLSTYANATGVVFTSGFLNPALNENGKPFGQFIVFNNGTVIELSKLKTARLQVIHNSADSLLENVDVWINGDKTINNMKFRDATMYMDIPAEYPLNVGIADNSSSVVTDTLRNFEFILDSGKTYILIAQGVVNTSLFAPNPDGKNIDITLLPLPDAREQSSTAGNVEFMLVHGSTDYETVDMHVRNGAQIGDNLSYGDNSAYASLPAANYILDMKDAAGAGIIASYQANLANFADSTAVIFSSAHKNPQSNWNGKPFAWYIAYNSGYVIKLQEAATSRLQVIHNCADPAADAVDVYVDGTLTYDDLAFRAATAFADVAPGIHQIGIAPKTSASVNDTIKNYTIDFKNGKTYIAIAMGVITPANFAVNPDAIAIDFMVNVKDTYRETANNAGNVDFVVAHGSTDAPTVDVIARNVATVANNAAYSDITGYNSLAANNYIFDVTDANNANVLFSYQANLTSLAGKSAVVFASGFINPAANQNGAAFGLFAALPDGNVIPFTPITSARLQLVHNAADPAAALVDVYVNGTLAYDDFAFRNATPFSDIAAGVLTNIGIAPSTSTSVNDTIKSIDVTFDIAKTYIVFVNGVTNAANFVANPDGKNISLNAYAINDGRETGSNPAKFDVNVFHGVTDAPTIDVVVRNGGILADNKAYGDYNGYVSVDTANYILDVTPGSNNNTILKSYRADLLPLGGQSGVVFASGFLDSLAANQTAAPFGLYMVFPQGYVIPLTEASEARIQVIHNCADPAADSVDVYVNGFLLVDNFPFRTATPFISIGAGVTYNVGIAPKNSSSANDTIRNFEAALENGKTYIAIASGVISPASFSVNPDGKATDFNVWLTEGVRETSALAGNFDFITINGITDAPTVDLIARNVMTLNDNIAYSDISAYSTLPGGQYLFDVTDATNTTTFSTYNADLTSLIGKAGVVFGSGFVTPANNQNGVLYGLWVAMPDGSTFPLPIVTAINETFDNGTFTMYPNPAIDNLTIALNNNQKNVQVQIMNNVGQVILSQTNNANANSMMINIAALPAGIYAVQLIGTNDTVSTKFVKQ